MPFHCPSTALPPPFHCPPFDLPPTCHYVPRSSRRYTGLSLPFVACAAGLGASSLTGALLLPETLHEATSRAAKAAAKQPNASAEEVSVARLLGRPALQGLCATILTNGIGQGAMPITMVLYAVETVGMSSAAVGSMLTANVLLMVIASVPASRLSDRVADRKSVMLPALFGGTAFFAAQVRASDCFRVDSRSARDRRVAFLADSSPNSP